MSNGSCYTICKLNVQMEYPMYIRKGVVSINEFEVLFKDTVLSNMDAAKCKTKIAVNGEPIKAVSDRYKCFISSGYNCVSCGVKGTHFAIERTESDTTYHLNLYSVVNGQDVLMTKDHIMPKSKGGRNHYSNYQTMCTVCNASKGNNDG